MSAMGSYTIYASRFVFALSMRWETTSNVLRVGWDSALPSPTTFKIPLKRACPQESVELPWDWSHLAMLVDLLWIRKACRHNWYCCNEFRCTWHHSCSVSSNVLSILPVLTLLTWQGTYTWGPWKWIKRRMQHSSFYTAAIGVTFGGNIRKIRKPDWAT